MKNRTKNENQIAAMRLRGKYRITLLQAWEVLRYKQNVNIWPQNAKSGISKKDNQLNLNL